MPQVPIILPRVSMNVPEFVSNARVWEQAGRTFDTIAGLIDESQKQQDALDFAKLSGDYEYKLDALKDELTQEPDYQKRIEQYNSRAIDLQNETLQQTQSRAVQQALNIHIGRILPQKSLTYKRDMLKEWGQARLGELETQEDTLADRVVNAATPEEADRFKRIQQGLVMGLAQGPGAPLNPLAAEKRIQAFGPKIAERLATKITKGNPDNMQSSEVVSTLTSLGMPEERILFWQSRARDEAFKMESRADQVMRKNRQDVKDMAEAQANSGKLNPQWIQDGLDGKLLPLVTPAMARELKHINDNPPSGEGDNSAKAIWDIYTQSDRSFASIAKAREALRRLPTSNDKLKYQNELQSDATTLQNQAIAREANAIAAQNRDIHNLKNEYDAWVDKNPIVQKILGNLGPQEKAQIESIYRSQGKEAALKKLDSFKAGITKKEETINKEFGDVLDFGKK